MIQIYLDMCLNGNYEVYNGSRIIFSKLHEIRSRMFNLFIQHLKVIIFETLVS